ncbi:MAG: transcription-repair coupling factor, partial [Clostridia bacterium]|nr:transcription-repair coupling factor [Clostridia bacterium]
DLVPGVPTILWGVDALGFELPESHFAVLSTYPTHTAYAKAVAGRAKKNKKKKSAAERILSYADLTVGDYVVHVNHGIGQYMGIQTITGVDGNSRDYVKIKYAGADALFLPCEQLDMISKYIGAHADDGLVKLSKMGGTEWGKTKARVKAAAKSMAKELIALYAARLRKPGFAFSPDDEMQRAFESVFPYEETESQVTAIEEIKADMQRPTPMDRLLCGDVGYGKTEVALRAAMKAVENGKQVAILVPTTILALQHYQTILSRFRGLPVHVEILSRFRMPTQQEEIIRRVRRGEIDIIVGTHRLVSKDVAFRDLGLVIIDEEQRFGVAAKEKLKTLSENVDCLMLSATPIPRTLNMAMSGIRDMSVLDEAPGDRVPVQSYVLEYDELILSEALKKELRRGGQVFWLHNRVEDIDACAARVAGLAPDAVIAIAHGKMDKEEISDIWQKLLTGEVDILISTTIIETGIDIPNANTLVIENADRMGLSQLHQIRGRIGRSSRRAYAYFTYPKGKTLTEIATKRLQAIREYTEFGSGFKIAMRDLEIRGAGNILGAEQHGHMESVGYDLYIKLLNEAILEEKGGTVKAKTEAVIDISLDAYLPERYVRAAAQRIDLYKKIAAIETPEDKADILDELADRFGNPPKAAQNLVEVAYLRAQASALHIARIEAKLSSLAIYPAYFDGAAWSTCAKLLMADALPTAAEQAEQKAAAQAAAAKPAAPRQRYATPLARAAAIAAAGHARTAPETAPQPKDNAYIPPIKLTLSAGEKPCINARLPRGMGLMEGMEKVLAAYQKTQKT